MQSRYDDEDARAAIERWGAHGEAVALRVYTSRLIGQEPELVLHGGGNTSVKGTFTTLLGDEVACLWVKGSGSSLDRVEPRDLPAVDLGYLRRLRALDVLSDEEMVNQLRTHLFDASAPNPSVEALLHAFLPHTFVDHSHADAIVVVTNQPNGGALAADALGDGVLVLPFIMPGFPLAKAVADAIERAPDAIGIVLEKHGLFTFGATARESYERHVALVDRAERFAKARSKRPLVSIAPIDPDVARERAAAVAPILRGLLAEASPEGTRRVVAELDTSEATRAALELEDAAAIFETGPLTPDHVIRTKAEPLFVAAPAWDDGAKLARMLREGVAAYRARYDAYFERACAARGVRKNKLDAAPRVVLLPGLGALAFGRTKQGARIASDITRHTLRGKALAASIGTYEALGELDLFDMEYWSLEQAKLKKETELPLSGRVALVTGAASGIGRATVQKLLGEGAHVVAFDRAEVDIKARPELVCVKGDVTSKSDVTRAMHAAVRTFGGLDVVVSNAGSASEGRLDTDEGDEALRKSIDINLLSHNVVASAAADVMRRQRRGGAILFNASKSAFNQGPGFGPYSVPKAALVALMRQYAVDLARFGIRANAINADRIRTNIFAGGVLESRAAARGISVDDYFRANLL
ncbi:MAG TPA: bifunctional aldolase/short-chain dehydrogenase, partial [Polyangiaceae bacterium]|nr:bifunctional aldolase/short-chain dehydrogenase [Polyangiaceae bacterium]